MCIRDSSRTEPNLRNPGAFSFDSVLSRWQPIKERLRLQYRCLLYTSDAADERSSVDLGGRRIIKKKNNANIGRWTKSTKHTDKLHEKQLRNQNT